MKYETLRNWTIRPEDLVPDRALTAEDLAALEVCSERLAEQMALAMTYGPRWLEIQRAYHELVLPTLRNPYG